MQQVTEDSESTITEESDIPEAPSSVDGDSESSLAGQVSNLTIDNPSESGLED